MVTAYNCESYILCIFFVFVSEIVRTLGVILFAQLEEIMAAVYGAYGEKSESAGLGWADQWDYKFNDKEGKGSEGGQKGSGNKEKMAEYNRRVKAAAGVGMDKTKIAVSVGAHKMKVGTTTSIRWIKEKVQKKPQWALGHVIYQIDLGAETWRIWNSRCSDNWQT